MRSLFSLKNTFRKGAFASPAKTDGQQVLYRRLHKLSLPLVLYENNLCGKSFASPRVLPLVRGRDKLMRFVFIIASPESGRWQPTG